MWLNCKKKVLPCERINPTAKGGEGGEVHGMNYRSDAPAFFEKVVFDTRKFEKKNYLFAIPQEDILRVEKLVQNPGWGIE